MPGIETAWRNQFAVLWEANGVDDYGQVTVGQPTEIKVRWEQKEIEGVGSDGSPVKFDATVVVDREIEIGSILWKGRQKDLPSGNEIPGLHKFTTLNEAEDIFGRHTRRELMLTRFKGKLPTVV